MTSKKIFERQVLGTYVDTMLNSVPIFGLRYAYKKIAAERTVFSKFNTKEKLAKHLKSKIYDQDKLLNLLFEAESSRPFVHVFVSGVSKRDKLSCNSIIGAVYNGVQGYFDELRCDFFTVEKDIERITFSHEVETTRWENSGDTRRAIEVNVRIPYIVTILKSKFVFISYPGVSKSRNLKLPLPQSKVVELISDVLFDEFGIVFNPFNFRKVVDSFLDKQLQSVSFLNLGVRNLLGDMNFEADSESLSAEKILPGLMHKHLPGVSLDDLQAAFVEAVRECEQSKAVLYWAKQGFTTSLKYWENGTEVSFVWNRSAPSYEKVLSILKFLIVLAKSFSMERSVAELFLKSDDFRTFKFEEIVSECGGDEDLVKKQLAKLVSIGAVKPVFRLNSHNKFEGYLNSWSEDVLKLRREFKTLAGEILDGSNPKNIQVAYALSSQEQA